MFFQECQICAFFSLKEYQRIKNYKGRTFPLIFQMQNQITQLLCVLKPIKQDTGQPPFFSPVLGLRGMLFMSGPKNH